MQGLFLELVRLSLLGSFAAFGVMGVRLLFRRAPRWLFCLLWAAVALRLVCPFTLESRVSLVPDRVANGQYLSNGAASFVGETEILHESSAGYTDAPETGREPGMSEDGYYVETEKNSFAVPGTVGETVYPVLGWVWFAGMLLMVGYAGCSFYLLRKRMQEATRLRENIWQCEQVESPFVLGLLKPRIYLPYTLGEAAMDNVIAHERAHIRRGDHWWKPLGFLVLSVHWFNPVIWLSYILLCRDIETACDEKVIRNMDKDCARAYSAALLRCCVSRRRISACPLAFGEVGVKERIRRVMNYRKPGLLLVLLVLVVSAAVCVMLLTNPAPKNTVLTAGEYQTAELLYTDKVRGVKIYSSFRITEDHCLHAKRADAGEWDLTLQMETYPLTAGELKKYAGYKNGWHSGYNLREITDAYIACTEDQSFYLVMQTKNGDTLLGHGRDDAAEEGQAFSDDAAIDYLYRLEAVESGLEHTDAPVNIWGELVAGTVYVPYQCIYMNPLSSFAAIGGDSGYKYRITEDSFDMIRRPTQSVIGAAQDTAGGNVTSYPVEKWEWQAFPFSDKEWAALYRPNGFNAIDKISGYFETMGCRYITDDLLLLKLDDALWLVKLSLDPRVGTYIWSIYSLIPEAAMGAVQWEYAPVGSEAPVFRFKPDMEYTSISVSCDNGRLVDWENKQSMDSKYMDYSVPSGIYWSPLEEDGSHAASAKITFLVSRGDIPVCQGHIYIESEPWVEMRRIYTVTVVGTGLRIDPAQEFAGGTISLTKGKNRDTAFELNLAGNTSMHNEMTLTEERPYWCISVRNKGTETIAVEIDGEVYEVMPESLEVLWAKEPWKPGGYTVSFSTKGSKGMEGTVICEVMSTAARG